jgi:hypothetical protein
MHKVRILNTRLHNGATATVNKPWDDFGSISQSQFNNDLNGITVRWERPPVKDATGPSLTFGVGLDQIVYFPILPAVVFDLPPRADFTPILSSATFPGQATIASVTRGVAPRWEEVSVASAIVVDPRLASVHEKAPGPMAALWPDPGPLQWSWPNSDLFPQEAGLAR